MSEDALSAKRRKIDDVGEADGEEAEGADASEMQPDDQSGPLEAEGAERRAATKKEAVEEEVDVIGHEEEHEAPISSPQPSTDELQVDDESMRTPTKKRQFSTSHPTYSALDDFDEEPERIYSTFPCHVIPETLGRMTRTPPDGERLLVFKNQNGRLRIFCADFKGRYSVYSTLTHKPCTVCNRHMKYGEMHLNFPADLDRRRIWANLLGFKYKDILRSKLGPVSLSISSGPICTEHFAEECFRNHNFNKAAIEAFGVPVAISPDVKTTPSKKRVPWVCTICDFHSCSVVELQTHLLDHTEEMMKQKDSAVEVPEAGFMCPFCRKCTYGYKTITGYRRHLASGPIHHCHLRRIYEFAKMNCRATELDPMDSWDNWTRRNVYVAYHGCEPPANEIVLTPSPTKKAYAQNPEERTRMVHDAERRKKAVRSLSFVGKEGGTSVNDHNVMQRQVYLQIRREMVHAKKAGVVEEEMEVQQEEEVVAERRVELQERREREAKEKERVEEPVEEAAPIPQAPKVDSVVKKEKPSASTKKPTTSSESATSSPTKKTTQKASATTTSAPPTPTPAKKRKVAPAAEEPKAPSAEPEVAPPAPEQPAESVEEARLRKQQIDERFAEMVAKRAQQVKRLINAKKFKQAETSPQKPRKALQYTLRKGVTFTSGKEASPEPSTSAKPPTPPAPQHEATPEPPSNAPSTSTKKKSETPEPTPTTRVTRSQKSGVSTPASASSAPKPTRSSSRKASESASKASEPKKAAPQTTTTSPEERPLKSMLARSLTAGVRPSMAQYRLPMESASSGPSGGISTGAGTSKSMSTGAIMQNRAGSASPGGLFSQRVLGAVQQEKGAVLVGGGRGGASKRPAVLARRPIILSPRKRASTPRPISHHESSPIISSASVPMGISIAKSTSSTSSTAINPDDEILIAAKDLEVEMIEEVVDSVAAGHSGMADDVLIPSAPAGALGAAISATPMPGANIPVVTYASLTLAEALDQEGASSVKDHEFEDISKKMGDGVTYCRAMEDVIKSRTVTKMRADMRLSRHCIRQIEAARARARLFGEGTDDYQIYYSTEGAEVLSKNDPKWRELTHGQHHPSNQPGPSDQA